MIFSTKQKNKSLNRGFSLVEVLIYIFVFMVVVVSSVSLLFSLQSLVYEHRANQVMTRNVTNMFERILFDIRAADSVDTGSSVLGSTPGTLMLINGATTTEYSLSSGALVVSVNGGTAYPLTTGTFSITDLQFDSYDNTLTEAVRLSFTAQSSWGESVVSKNFTNTAVLLNSYD